MLPEVYSCAVHGADLARHTHDRTAQVPSLDGGGIHYARCEAVVLSVQRPQSLLHHSAPLMATMQT